MQNLTTPGRKNENLLGGGTSDATLDNLVFLTCTLAHARDYIKGGLEKRGGNVKKAVGKSALKESLYRQLELKHADIDVFKEQIDQYIYFWETAQEIKKDIKKRGKVYEEPYNSSGSVIVRIHPGIKELRDLNKQMLAILKQLDLSTKNIALEDDEDEAGL